MNSALPTAAQWPEISRLLDEVLALPAGDREPWLARLANANPIHHEALRGLLATLERVEADFLDELPHLDVDAAGRPPELTHGQTVGPYRLLHEIGVGGMGTVWLAERADGAVRRRVALKLPRAAWGGSFAGRLARESRILAALEHEHIARLYDAGLDGQGRPFLALEYVEGQPLDVYCAERALSLREREGLLLQTMAAVAHAHARLVVHRDLKPANILVTRDGRVKLLDFGIAKLLESGTTAATALTQVAGRALTLDYASPEQIRGDPLGTGSDVYSLGVVAYELLAEARPYRLRRGTAAEMEEAIANAEPTLASAAATSPALRKALRGDLDAILNKALKKDVDARYAGVDAFAQDLQRHLQGKPVHARPDGRGYRIAKFLRRNRLAVGLTSTLAASVVIGGSLAAWQAHEARRQEARARIEANRQLAVRDLYDETMMGLSVTAAEHPDALKRPHAITDALLAKLREIEPRFRTRPEERSAQFDAVAQALNYDNAFEASRALTDDYLAHLRAHGGTPFQVIYAYALQGRNLGMMNRFDESEAARREGLAWAPGVDEDDENTIMARLQIATDLGNILARRGKRDEALQVLNRAQAIAMRRPADDAARWENRFYLSTYYRVFDDIRQMQNAQAAHDGMQAVTNLDPDSRGLYLRYYGMALLDNGRPAEAEKVLRTSSTLNTQAYGHNSLNSARAIALLASAIIGQGDYPRANALLDDEIRRLESGNVPAAPDAIAKLRERRLDSDLAAGDVAGVRARVTADPTALSTAARVGSNTATLMTNARALAFLNRGDEAVNVMEFTRNNWPAPGLATADCASIQQSLVLAQLAAKRPDTARTTARELVALFEREHATASRTAVSAYELEALASARLGDAPAAARALASADRAQPVPPYASDVARADSLLRRAEILQAIARPGDATAAARTALALLGNQHPDSPRQVRARLLAGG